MDRRLNPYAPGAGAPPPELAGRDELIERASIALDRIRAGRSARSFILYGLRGVGKTVLLNRIRQDAVTAVGPVRNALIAKGMLYSPAHGDTAFTVPLFDGFMKRIMPDL